MVIYGLLWMNCTLEGYGGLVRTDFRSFPPWEVVVIL